MTVAHRPASNQSISSSLSETGPARKVSCQENGTGTGTLVSIRASIRPQAPSTQNIPTLSPLTALPPQSGTTSPSCPSSQLPAPGPTSDRGSLEQPDIGSTVVTVPYVRSFVITDCQLESVDGGSERKSGKTHRHRAAGVVFRVERARSRAVAKAVRP